MGAFGTATSTFAAQNYGREDYQRVRQGIRHSLIITLFAALGLMLFVALLGKTMASTWVCVSEIMTRIVTTYLLVYRLGFSGMIFVSPVCWTVSSILLIIIYRPMMIQAGVIRNERNPMDCLPE